MVSSNSGGGRGRGRPVILTPEQRIERERERWRRKRAAQYKRAGDAKWERSTNFGYFVPLWVPHYNRLTEALVGERWLREGDFHIAPRVDAAVDNYFKDATFAFLLRSGSARKLAGDCGTVRARMTQELATKLVEYEYWERGGDHPRFSEWQAEEHARRVEELNRARVSLVECRKSGLFDEAFEIEEECERLSRRLDSPRCKPQAPPEQFSQELLGNKNKLVRVAETCLYRFYCNYIPKPPWHPCNCKLELPECDCPSRFKPDQRRGILHGPPKPKGPEFGKVLAKQSLYSGPVPRWWRTQKPRYENDQIIRSHARLVEEPPREEQD